MMTIPNIGEMSVFARSVWFATQDASTCEIEAVAWMLKNRILREDASSQYLSCRVRARADRQLARVCRQFLDEESKHFCHAQLKAGLGDPTLFWRALDVACLVWNGDVADPTCGATRCHRHDETPDWAEHMSPTALIGSRLFYPSSSKDF